VERTWTAVGCTRQDRCNLSVSGAACRAAALGCCTGSSGALFANANSVTLRVAQRTEFITDVHLYL